MRSEKQVRHLVAVIGAGPAGLYAAKNLADAGIQVSLFNRDIKPGGLAEYGIYHDKYRMKEGLRRQFRRILASPDIRYYGNVVIAEEDGDLTMDDLRALGHQALLVTVGAQGTKWLGLPGEELTGVYHAKDLVYHYNLLPPYSQQDFRIGRRAALIGVGNVMVDVAHWLVRDVKIDEVLAVARRGPAEVKFTRKEMQSIIGNVDLDALDAELARVTPVMEAVDQDPAEARAFILSAQKKGLAPISNTRFRFEFLASPSRIVGDEQGQVRGLEVEDTALVATGRDTKVKRLGTKRILDVDTVVFCIGDRVDENLGLPVQWNAFVKHPNPRFPISGSSYEAYDPEAGRGIEDVFMAGWAREASSGLVGAARKDGTQGSEALMQFLQRERPPMTAETLSRAIGQLEVRLAQSGKVIVDRAGWQRIEAAEQVVAAEQGLEAFKFASNEEMLAVLAA